MKHFTLISILLLLSSCTTHKVISSLSVTTELEEATNVILVNIEAIDNDGISAVDINIDAFDYQAIFDQIQGTHWAFERTFTLGHSTDTNPMIEVTVTDAMGNQKTKVKPAKLSLMKLLKTMTILFLFINSLSVINAQYSYTELIPVSLLKEDLQILKKKFRRGASWFICLSFKRKNKQPVQSNSIKPKTTNNCC